MARRDALAELEGIPTAAHLFELPLRLHLLREQRGLDPVEEPFEPADELGLRDAQLALARRVAAERQGDLFELLAEVGRQDLLELVDRAFVDLLQRTAARVVERRASRFVEQRADHRRDPDELGGPGDLLTGLRIGGDLVEDLGGERLGRLGPVAGGRCCLRHGHQGYPSRPRGQT